MWTLLAFLALEARAPVSRRAIAMALWPDAPESEALGTLRRNLHRLSKAFGEGRWIHVSTKHVTLPDAEGLYVDVRDFERRLLNGTPEDIAALDSADLAVELEGEWVEAPRNRLRERFLGHLKVAADAAATAGELALAECLYQRILTEDPWREDALRGTMRARIARGDRAGAIASYRRLAADLARELGVDPMPESVALYEEIARNAPGPAACADLPESRTSFVGRDEVLADAANRLAAHRLVTIVGPGGVGKSRLAMEISRGVSQLFPGGLRLVEFAASTNATAVVERIARALDVEFRDGDDVLANVARAIGERHVLIILDTCEHLITAIARTAEVLLQRTRHLRLIATSREPLNLVGESVVALDPLAIPRDDSRFDRRLIEATSATALFLDRALAAGLKPPACEADYRAIVWIVRRIDALPLAIELAAARARGVSAVELAAMLADGPISTFLRDARAVPQARHETLDALLMWSYALLSPEERRAFRALGTFSGAFTRADAQAVCRVDARSIVDLHAKSLLVRARDDDRFYLLETIAEFASRALDECGEVVTVRRRHVAYLAKFARSLPSGIDLDRAAAEALLARLDDLERAIDWALAEPGDAAVAADLIFALVPYWYAHGLSARGIARLDTLAERLGERAEARRCVALAHMHRTAYRHAEAARVARSALDLATKYGEAGTRCDALTILASAVARSSDDTVEVRAHVEGLAREALALAIALEDDLRRAEAIAAMGHIAYQYDRVAEALSHFENALQIFTTHERSMRSQMCRLCIVVICNALGRYEDAREIGRRCVATLGHGRNPLYRAIALGNLAEAETRCGDLEAAGVHYRRSLALYAELEQWRMVGVAIHGIAALFERRGRARDAALLFGYVWAAVERGEIPRSKGDHDLDRTLRAQLVRRLGATHFGSLVAAGRLLPREDAIATALDTEVGVEHLG